MKRRQKLRFVTADGKYGWLNPDTNIVAMDDGGRLILHGDEPAEVWEVAPGCYEMRMRPVQ